MYSAKLVSLELFGFPSTESPLVHEIRKLLGHELFDLLNSLVETFFRRARNVKV